MSSTDSATKNLDAIEQTVAKYSMKCDFERTGTLTVAVEPHQIEWLDADGRMDAVWSVNLKIV